MKYKVVDGRDEVLFQSRAVRIEVTKDGDLWVCLKANEPGRFLKYDRQLTERVVVEDDDGEE